jgi:hypothetical protein
MTDTTSTLTLANFNQPRYWLWWTAATLGGWLIGYLINNLIIAAFNLTEEVLAQSARPELMLASILAMVSMGLSVGLLQWLVLRREVPSATLWVPATAFGFAAGIWLGLAFMGLGTGLAQWWVVRQTFSKGSWWPTISAVIWPLGYLAGGAVGGALISVTNSQLLAGGIGILVTGLIIGAVTGAVLLWMLREKRLEEAV